MGMSIENCKKRLVIEKELAIKTGLNHDANGTLADAIDVAIDTMRKYQKIEAIAEKCNLKLLPKEAMSTFMKDVLEVLEDGNDNNANE